MITPTRMQVRTYTAKIIQTSTNPPTAVELINTTKRTIAWTRTGIGTYKATLSSPIEDINDISVLVSSGNGAYVIMAAPANTTEINVATTNEFASSADGIGTAFIKIEIFEEQD